MTSTNEGKETMMKPLYKYIKESKPCGVKSICNTFGVGIWDLDGEECIAAWSGIDGYYTASRHKIHYSAAGRPYIRKGSMRLYLDEFVRT